VATSPQTLGVEERRLLAAWAADRAERVLPIFEAARPGDARVRLAVAQARAFAAGALPVADAIRRRGGAAGAAAREAPTPAARAAAYAAEQAAACAHMGAHALGAAGYAAKALALSSGDGGDEVVREECRRVLAGMSPPVVRALSSLPALGEDPAGPLAPGRLSAGHVGAMIRAIQSSLHHLAR